MSKSLASILLFIIFLGNVNLYAQRIHGKVLDANTKKPLQYVNVGIIGKEIGSITNSNGEFEFNKKSAIGSDTLKISMIGYKAEYRKLSEIQISESITIYLLEHPTELKEVIVRDENDQRKILGVKGVSGFMQTGWGYGVTGGERGIRIKSKKTYSIDEVNFHIASIGFDSVMVRFHVRSLDAKLQPMEDVIDRNIYFVIRRNETGWISRDISDYNISISQKEVLFLLSW